MTVDGGVVATARTASAATRRPSRPDADVPTVTGLLPPPRPPNRPQSAWDDAPHGQNPPGRYVRDGPVRPGAGAAGAGAGARVAGAGARSAGAGARSAGRRTAAVDERAVAHGEHLERDAVLAGRGVETTQR